MLEGHEAVGAGGSSEASLESGVLPEEPGWGRSPIMRTTERRMSHFVSCVGSDSIVFSPSSFPFLSLLRPLNIWSLPFYQMLRTHADSGEEDS